MALNEQKTSIQRTMTRIEAPLIFKYNIASIIISLIMLSVLEVIKR
jgi:hypothetical protein